MMYVTTYVYLYYILRSFNLIAESLFTFYQLLPIFPSTPGNHFSTLFL